MYLSVIHIDLYINIEDADQMFSVFEGELESTIAELEESNKKLAVLKAETDAAKGGIFPVILGNKRVANDRTRVKEKDLHYMDSLLN